MIKLSIIVPMYNVEPYVERCLRSLVCQDISSDEFEIICINDGSPDNSRGVVIRFQDEFRNIVLIDKENQGVSLARNDGINRARGKYILFIDPDDYVYPNCFWEILQNADHKNAQVSFLGFTFLNEDGTVRKEVLYEEYSSGIFDGLKAYFLSRGDGSTDPDRTWAVLFNKAFLNSNHLRYLPNVPYLEDGELIARIMCLATSCIFEGHPCYLRTTRIGSATNSSLYKSEKAATGFLASACNLTEFRDNQNLSQKQKQFLNQPICKFVLLTLKSSLQKPDLKQYLAIRKRLKRYGFQKLEINGVVKPYIYFAFIYNNLRFMFLLNAMLKDAVKALQQSLTRNYF